MDLTLYDLLLLKEKENGENLIYIKFNKHNYVFRHISIDEYTQCKILTLDKYSFNDAICQVALVYPEDLSFAELKLGGVADYAAEQIIDKSLIFQDKKLLEILEENRNKNKTFLRECKLLIKAAFPEYSLREINNWSYTKLMEMTAAGERILQLRGLKTEDGEPFKIQFELDEEKIKEQEKELTDKELIEKNIDPMIYRADKIQLKKPLIDDPVILGPDWRNEELSIKVGRQILGR